MENVILIIHLILAFCLIGIVLLQRAEGGGLGMGGGGGGGGVMSGRAAATALAKLTWLFAIAFIGTSITLTIIAASKSADTSVLDRLGVQTTPAPKPDQTAPADSSTGSGLGNGAASGSDLLPPAPATGPALPPRAQ